MDSQKTSKPLWKLGDSITFPPAPSPFGKNHVPGFGKGDIVFGKGLLQGKGK